MQSMADGAIPVEAWLYDYDEQERRLKEYYMRHGHLLPAAPRDDPDEDGPPDTDPLWDQILTDSMFINNHTDVAIVKHPRYKARFNHSHTFFEVSYVFSGSCRHTIHEAGGEEGLDLQTGDVLILPPSIIHSILAEGDSIIVNLLLRRSTFESIFLRGIPMSSVLSDFFTGILYSNVYANFLLIQTGDHPLIRSTFHSILQEYLSNKVFASEVINQHLSLFFLYLLRECGSNMRISRRYHKETQFIPAILHYLELHYATTSVGELADHFGYDISHLCRMYKKHTGMTLRDTLRQIRMRHATELLRKSSHPVDDIAAMVGYRDVSSFIRRFRQQFGQTPLQYRKQGRQAG